VVLLAVRHLSSWLAFLVDIVLKAVVDDESRLVNIEVSSCAFWLTIGVQHLLLINQLLAVRLLEEAHVLTVLTRMLRVLLISHAA